MSKHIFEAELCFTVHEYFSSKKRFIKVNVDDIFSKTPYKMSEYYRFIYDIYEIDYIQDLVEGINIKELNDEYSYSGKAKIELEYESSYDNWSGAYESDINVCIIFYEYKQDERLDKNTLFEPTTCEQLFDLSTNKDADYLKIRYINEDKLLVQVGHCCVSRRFIIHPMTLTKLLFDYETNGKD